MGDVAHTSALSPGILLASFLACASSTCDRSDPTSPSPTPAPVAEEPRPACPAGPEDFDGFEDEDGCVDPDNDGDGILDAAEYIDGRWTSCDFEVRRDGTIHDCRNLPEDVDGVADLDGCPDLADCENPRPRATIVFDKAGRAPDLDAAVDAVAEAALTDPMLTIWIEAYLDKERGERELALARTLVDRIDARLRAKGVAAERIQHHSGRRRVRSSEPLTAKEREYYRRIELGADDFYCYCVEECRHAPVCR